LFSGEDTDKRVGVLSGGERTRLALCQLLLSPSNFLILDEPTNHLDIQSKEVLKQALQSYEGTFIVVSHDREFLDGLTNRIWDIDNKTLKIHHFGVKEFLEQKMQSFQDVKAPNPQKIKQEEIEAEKPVEQKLSYEEAKEQKRLKTQLNNQLSKAEKAIEECETKLKEMDAVIANLDYSDEVNAAKVLIDYDAIKKLLDPEMEKWEKTTEELFALD
jgi:ATP-binding cassette subfamily F protein 3